MTVLSVAYYSPDLYASVDSVLKQDYPHIQYVLVDDGSESFDAEEVTAYIEKHRLSNIAEIIVIQNAENLGTVRTSNIGLKQARGEYIFNLAGDDAFADGRVLSDWVAAFQRSGALFMTARRDVYDEHLTQCIGQLPEEDQIRMLQAMKPQELFEEIAAVNFIFGCCTARARRCLELYGYYDERYRLIEDHPMNLRLLRQGVPIIFFDRCVVHYRGNGTSSAGKYNAVYERDADLVFEHEAMPYSKYPSHIKKQYTRWKRRQELGRKFQKKIALSKGKPVSIFGVMVWYLAHHPASAIRKFLKDPKIAKHLIGR